MEGLGQIQTGLVALLNLTFAGLLGAAVSDWWLDGDTSRWASMARRPVRVAVGVACGLTLIASIGLLWLQTATMAELPLLEARAAMISVLLDTHYGHAWLVGVLALLSVAALQLPRQGGWFTRCGIFGAIVVFALSRSAVSHAVVGGNLSWPVAVEAAHMILIGVWVGVVLMAGLIVLGRPVGSLPTDRTACHRYIADLSRSATVALVGILITGGINTWRSLESLDHLFDNPWSIALAWKLSVVAVAIAFGAFNRWLVMPPLLRALRQSDASADHAQRRFVSILRIEAMFLFIVLVAAAILSASAPQAAS
ncbi:MAG: hypothetical protein NVSMB28_06820 [Collimonas sp.]